MNDATNPSAGRATSSWAERELAQLAVDDHADAVGERGRVLVVVRDEQRRQAELAQQLLQLAADRDLRVRVERRERLVEQQHAGVARERAGERDALALAAGELGRPRLREVRDPEPLEVLVDAARARRRRRSGARSCAGRARTPGRRARRDARPACGRRPARSRTRRRRRARSGPTVGARARRPRGAPTSCRRPTARRARPCPRSRARARARTTRSGSAKLVDRVATAVSSSRAGRSRRRPGGCAATGR